MSEPEYIDKRAVDVSYRPKGHGISPGLQRARAPYRLRNAITGVSIFSFAVGVWAYSINAVKQDKFEDIDEEARHLSARKMSKESGEPDVAPESSRSQASTSSTKLVTSPSVLTDSIQHRGIWVGYLEHYLDPRQKTLVWGAPPLDPSEVLKDGLNT